MVYIVNNNPNLKTMVEIIDEAVDVRLNNTHFMALAYCERMVKFDGNANNAIITGCEFEFIDHVDTSYAGYDIIAIEYTGNLHNHLIHHNIFTCNNDINYNFTAIKVNTAELKYCTFDNNHIYMQHEGKGYFINGSNGSKLYKISIAGNNMHVCYFDFLRLDGFEEVERIIVSNNIGSISNEGYFIYSGLVNVNNSTIIGNNIHENDNTNSVVDMSGYHTVLSNNCIVGDWWGQTGNACLALNNINANIQGIWSPQSTGNITTI